eukprot:5903333-Amphidinium_carterae.1
MIRLICVSQLHTTSSKAATTTNQQVLWLSMAQSLNGDALKRKASSSHIQVIPELPCTQEELLEELGEDAVKGQKLYGLSIASRGNMSETVH